MDRPEFRVGRFVLSPHRQLLCDGVAIPIGRKALDLLSVLAQADGALVTKDELMAAVWPKAIVEDNAIQVRIAALRTALGPDADLLSTAHGLGYRLAVTAGQGEGQPAAPPAPPAQEPARQRLPTRALAIVLVVLAVVAGGASALFRNANQDARADTPPPIAVLTFQPADKSDEARLFAEGLARSVASSLSRYDVTVIAASSSLQLTPAQKPQARSLLGADFIVDGRIQSDRGKTTVSTQIHRMSHPDRMASPVPHTAVERGGERTTTGSTHQARGQVGGPAVSLLTADVRPGGRPAP